MEFSKPRYFFSQHFPNKTSEERYYRRESWIQRGNLATEFVNQQAKRAADLQSTAGSIRSQTAAEAAELLI